MTKEEFKEKFNATFDFVKVDKVMDVNHKPHPYIVGPQHVKHAAEKHGGMLGEATMNALPSCKPLGYRGSEVYLRDITYDKVAFLMLQRDVTNDEFATIAPMLEENADIVDGIALVETPGKYRIKQSL